MSNALPAALLRPSCAALRSSIPVTHQWNTVTRAFARQFCSSLQSRSLNSQTPPSLLSVLQSHKAALASTQHRAFSASPRSRASVSEPPPPNSPKKRTVHVGPLPCGDVDLPTLKRIFGPNISPREGNNVLRIIHHRRTSGSMADYGVDNIKTHTGVFNRNLAIKGLDWLRQEFPVDEARAAEEWAEKEANRIAYELWLQDPENLASKHNDPARAFREQARETREAELTSDLGEERIGILHKGPSQFELRIEKQRQKRLEDMARKAEEKEKKEADELEKLRSGEFVRTPAGTGLMKPGQTTYVDIFGREMIDGSKEYREKMQQKAQLPFKSEEELLAATTLSQRLIPMTCLVAATILGCYAFAHFYSPPDPAYRLFPDLSLTTATLVTIIGLNVSIALLWRLPFFWPFLTRNFMHIPAYPRAIQALTNVWSHVQPEHLLGNMFWLAIAGTVCHDIVGRGVFLGTYISAGAVGTLASLYWANIGRGLITAHSVGASAAVWGIATLYCLITDQERIKIPFLQGEGVTFWPKMLWLSFAVMEVYIFVRRPRGTADHMSHIGGMLTGVSVAGWLRWGQWKGQGEGVGMGMGKTGEMVDVGALIGGEVKEVKDAVTKQRK
ncbi:hypothetical protein BCR34DRAFT_603108 [Clohesyomyces aquaticus]|uniref:Peptidase S54 rhomboid domain-containing protein n=1 Tax=Clohesyomyces aquaticus TaxID=1231657 RepID=A0A1Y1ZGH2_9PLEO|nr:hypothetical protein BCR34DRAFT_603108 [Clohesyomyces aquaticus]